VQQSADVLHSLYIPAFRAKMDCVPGRYTYQWFEATQSGDYDLFCAEYCGKDHSNMNSIVVVHKSQAEFDAWLPTLLVRPDGETPAEYGAYLYKKKGCHQCHSTDGTARSGGGPSFKDTYGNTHKLDGGGTVVGNENYILESIRKPQAKIRQGYKGITMTTFSESMVKPQEVDAIIAFIRSLSDDYVEPEPTEEQAPETEESNAEESDTEKTEDPKEETP
ncbi:MAG: c-type cytochrome, partial [Aeoliella sp.]